MTDQLKSRVSFIFAVLINISVISNLTAQESTIVRDFNGNGTFDFLVQDMAWLDVDSWDYVLTDGKTGDRWGYVSEIDFAGTAYFIVPGKTRNELSESWEYRIKAMEDSLLDFRTTADPSLEWVLNAQVIESGVESGSLFDRVVKFKRKWYSGTPFIPENYTYQLNKEDLIFLENLSPFETYYWKYRSHNHKVKPEDIGQEDIEIDGDGILKTKHALIEVQGNQYAWVFMSGIAQTGGPSKLRWASMEKVVKHEDLVILQQNVIVGEFEYWIGNIEKGIWARISNENFENRIDFRVDKGKLIIIDGEGEVSFEVAMSAIQEALRIY